VVADLRQLRLQHGGVGDGVLGVGDRLVPERLVHQVGVTPGQQHLSARGGVHRGGPADPVAAGDRRAAVLLEDVRGLAGVGDREVDRLAELGGEAPAHRPALDRQLELGGGGAGESDDAAAQVVLAALLELLDEVADLQRLDQPERGRLVHAQLGGDLGDAHALAPPFGQQVQDRDGPVHRLHLRGGELPRVARQIGHERELYGPAGSRAPSGLDGRAWRTSSCCC
jgi:hypothetical protein